ncbi:hypothetical protein OG422_18440 [Streptomyces sp. NBC_01525]|uniref:Uncharacterized protein n=1 Tax=Streptomyces benahoarensis TaxID=2595054 RepID=A0A553ZPB2_9ACTN|nr:hypothetical protein [Streptomyces benahoarensis]TSB31455.1 hypothetical protein FNJ62_06120 [Streptomyces benahoarensis]TSB43297.1 hypothetical protein FNZ23_05305 [Streptomyces benahoarensis]
MIRRVAVAFGLVAFPSALLTTVGYVLATRTPGRYQRLFEGQWDAIAGGFTIATFGLLVLSYGTRRCFSVLGGFQPDNVRRGVLAMLGGILTFAMGGLMLWHLLIP